MAEMIREKNVSDKFQQKIEEYSKEIQAQIKDYSLNERIQWINDKKDEGSQLFKNQEWQEAIDVWMKALCGFEFSKYKK